MRANEGLGQWLIPAIGLFFQTLVFIASAAYFAGQVNAALGPIQHSLIQNEQDHRVITNQLSQIPTILWRLDSYEKQTTERAE